MLFSGNNFRPAGDLWRRLLTARIDAKMEAPERRSFDLHPVEHCRDNRQEIVAATLTLLRGFVAANSPRATSDRLASFEAWDDRVRQAVIWLGLQEMLPVSVGDPADAMERAKRDEPEHQKLAALLTIAHQLMGDRRWRVADLVRVSEEAVAAPTTCGEQVVVLREALEEIAGERGKINPRILGRWIEKQADRRCDGLWAERAGVRHKTTLWRVRGQPHAQE